MLGFIQRTTSDFTDPRTFNSLYNALLDPDWTIVRKFGLPLILLLLKRLKEFKNAILSITVISKKSCIMNMTIHPCALF